MEKIRFLAFLGLVAVATASSLPQFSPFSKDLFSKEWCAKLYDNHGYEYDSRFPPLVLKDGEECEDMKTKRHTTHYAWDLAGFGFLTTDYNDKISSIIVRHGCVLKAWENKDYNENKKTRTFTKDQENLKKKTEENPDNFGDKMSSFKCNC